MYSCEIVDVFDSFALRSNDDQNGSVADTCDKACDISNDRDAKSFAMRVCDIGAGLATSAVRFSRQAR